VGEVSVFARVTPEHKLAIVEALKQRGEVVAMTGDGVNDAPALKRADVGVAMGRRGSDVSREVADLVLLDDNFATIVAAIDEGRNIYENIQKFIHFLFSTNVSLVLLVAIGAIGSAVLDLREAGGKLLVPLTAVQLLWINIISNGPPALAIGLDRTPGVMARGPRPREAPCSAAGLCASCSSRALRRRRSASACSSCCRSWDSRPWPHAPRSSSMRPSHSSPTPTRRGSSSSPPCATGC
jgi:Ca2+-transporting ATPase